MFRRSNVFLMFVFLGLMHVWGVSLNSISMINLVMAIGFAVDYSAHLAHSFVFSAQSTPEEKAIDALRTVGASVIMGGKKCINHHIMIVLSLQHTRAIG